MAGELGAIYFDTSALAKWYLNEESSEAVEAYIQENGPVEISDLTVIEMRCLLARRRRERSIGPELEAEAFATFQDDIRHGALVCHPFPDGLAAGAVNLMAVLADVPLRTLDAMHLTIARDVQAGVLATADHVMMAAGRALGLSLAEF